MFIDTRAVPSGALPDSDVCIIGAGAAGIAMARALRGSGQRVALVESGGLAPDEDTQDLYAGTSIGRDFPGVAGGRLRYFGGTTNHWGGWCLPLDPVDFEARPGLPLRGWPINRTVLDPWYALAQDVLRLGPFDYRPASWGIPPQTIPDPFRGPHFAVRIMQCSKPVRFAAEYGPELRRADDVVVYLHANALGLDANEAASEVQALRLATLAGNRFTLRARRYVLAAGGIENARLLLLSGASGLGNAHDLVGRHFMAHLEYDAGQIALAGQPVDLGFCTNLRRHAGGRLFPRFATQFVSFIGVEAATLRRLALPNMRLMWTVEYDPGLRTVEAVRRLLHIGDEAGRSGDLGAVLGDIGSAGGFLTRKLLGRPVIPVRALGLYWTAEPMPNPDSRVRLGTACDALGQRRVELDWRLTALDKRKALEVQRLLAGELGKAGFGRLRIDLAEDEVSWPETLYGDEHHMGTTRMHADPRQGVVDADCRVHGLANLYVAGSSVFPTAGFANPTLTIVALALRLAGHLRRRA